MLDRSLLEMLELASDASRDNVASRKQRQQAQV
jgi:hypothetical protein